MSSVRTRCLIFTLLWLHLHGRIISCSVPSYSSEITFFSAITHRFISFAALILPISCRKIIPFSNQQVRCEFHTAVAVKFIIFGLWRHVDVCFFCPENEASLFPSKGWHGLPDYTVYIPYGHSIIFSSQ